MIPTSKMGMLQETSIFGSSDIFQNDKSIYHVGNLSSKGYNKVLSFPEGKVAVA